MKGKVGTIIVILFTFLLAGVAIFTAIRLYQLRDQAVAPNVPSSKPGAQELPSPNLNCALSFTLGTATPTPTATPTGTATPTPTPVPQCNEACTANDQCPSNLTCNIATGATSGFCRAAQCLTESDCICTTPTPTATPTSTPGGTPNVCNGSCGSNFNCQGSFVCYQGFCRNPSCTSSTSCNCGTSTSTPPAGGTGTPEPTLPQSGTSWPTVIGAGIGILVILGSFLLAL